MKHFRTSHRRMLRDALVASAIAAAAAGFRTVLTRMGTPHRNRSVHPRPPRSREEGNRRRIPRRSRTATDHARKTVRLPSDAARGAPARSAATPATAAVRASPRFTATRVPPAVRRWVPAAMTAAHRSLPFGTHVTVVNKNNGRSVVVRINDRGPFVRGRVIDLSPAAARALGVDGLASVSLSVLRRAERHADAKTRCQPSQSVAAGVESDEATIRSSIMSGRRSCAKLRRRERPAGRCAVNDRACGALAHTARA